MIVAESRSRSAKYIIGIGPALAVNLADTKDALPEQCKASVPLGRMGLAEKVASAALLLASNESSYITAWTCL